MYKFFEKNDQIICFRIIITFVLFSKFELGRTAGNFSQHFLPKREEGCTQYQFVCKSDRKCIDQFVICDGVKDCADGSDETAQLCSEISCFGNSFRCNYGACIDSKAKCDGRVDCVDASDETDLECPPLLTEMSGSKRCSSLQFQCTSGRCINLSLICNGKTDCDDGTDETLKLCENNKCPKTAFRCGYGACIDKKYRCDGVKHCPDGSDETSQTCRTKPSTTTPKPPATPNTTINSLGSCTLPPTSTDKKMTVRCPENVNCDHQPSRKVPKYTEVHFHCNPGYLYDDPEPFVSICSNGGWLPPIINCNKICKQLNPKNVDLVCYRKGTDVDCEGPLVTGTTVRPRCKPQHREEYPVYYRDITCQADGEWSNVLFPCVPECGKPYANITKLIALGSEEKYGDSPWHIAIYDLSEKDEPLICGGTIIAPQLIISAAHCFFDEYNQKPQNPEKYEIAVSKVTRNHTKKDNGLTKMYKIRRIFYSEKGFAGAPTNYAADIVILWVAEKIALSRGVLPACIHWLDNGPFNPGEGILGKVVGWGLDEKGKPSEILLAANLPYISYAKCVESANEDFKGSISLDKFCAGTKNGAGARRGDSGGGLLFRDSNTGLYYLQGIVSNKDPSETSIAAFTDVSHYIDWINEIRKYVDNEILAAETSLKKKT